MTYIPNQPEPTFYSQRARDNWLRSKADYEKAQQVAKERADRQRLIEQNSAAAVPQQIAHENYMKFLAECEKRHYEIYGRKLAPATSEYIGGRKV
jgi:hypothetical protein